MSQLVAFFRMSKYKTLAWALFCLGLAILLAYTHLGMCSGVFIFYAFCLGLTAAYKFNRDRGIIRRAALESQAPKQLEPPAMTSKGSTRLFVPEPRNHR